MSTPSVLTYRPTDGSVVHIECHERLASTAALAREYAAKGYSDSYCIYAEAQTDTSLTGTKVAEGEADTGVFLSCILRPRFFPSQACFLGELCAVALAGALEHHTDARMDIGWISDIFCEGKRIGGCSLESRLDAYMTYEYLIVSFAVHLDPKIFPCRLSDMMKTVFSDDHASVPLRMAKGILDHFYRLYRDMQNPKKFMDDYRRKFAMSGASVTYLAPEGARRGKILGIDTEGGHLLVDLGAGGIQRISGKSRLILPKRVRRRKGA